MFLRLESVYMLTIMNLEWHLREVDRSNGKSEYLSKFRCFYQAKWNSSKSISAPWWYKEYQFFHLKNLNLLPFDPPSNAEISQIDEFHNGLGK